jgi:hypothetical protein
MTPENLQVTHRILFSSGTGYGQQAQSTSVARHASRRNPSPAEVDDKNNDPLCTLGISALVCKKAGPAVVCALGVAGTSSPTFNLAEINR